MFLKVFPPSFAWHYLKQLLKTLSLSTSFLRSEHILSLYLPKHMKYEEDYL